MLTLTLWRFFYVRTSAKEIHSAEIHLDEMKAKWPSTVVARQQIWKFTGGLISPRTIANEDSLGTGPKGRFQLGKQNAYPVDSLIEWLKLKIKQREAGAGKGGRKARAR